MKEEMVEGRYSTKQYAQEQKYTVLLFSPCKMAIFQGLGGEPPIYPLSFVPDANKEQSQTSTQQKRRSLRLI